MLRVKEIMTPNVVTLAPNQTLRQAVDTLVTCRIQGAPVVDAGRVVGVLSAPDLLEFESVVGDETREDEADPVEEWSEGDEWSSRYFTDLWTGREDVVERVAAEGRAMGFLDSHTVGEAMSKTVCTLPADTEVSYAAQRLLEAGVQRAIVTDASGFVGILSATDILRAVAERRLTVRQMVFVK
ncbi:MAG: CBS domain-containing protein [Gemmatimonadaceae bacterium]|nr:CBS domain-containing protein [Gemmatimonadaceae bacterium]